MLTIMKPFSEQTPQEKKLQFWTNELVVPSPLKIRGFWKFYFDSCPQLYGIESCTTEGTLERDAIGKTGNTWKHGDLMVPG